MCTLFFLIIAFRSYQERRINIFWGVVQNIVFIIKFVFNFNDAEATRTQLHMAP